MTAAAAPTLRLVLSLSLVVLGAAACGDDAESNPSGSGGSGSGGGGSGGSTSTTGGSGGAGGSTSTTTASGPGGGGGAPESVLGTAHDGDCSTAQDFAAACEEEGGLLADNCQDATCGGPGWRATCYEPPPALTAAEFSCDGLFNCAVGELCSVVRPSPDGCYSHACEPIPPACVEDPTCTCLLELEPFAECEEDASGNPTIYDEI